MLMAALFIPVKNWKPPKCPSKDNLLKIYFICITSRQSTTNAL